MFALNLIEFVLVCAFFAGYDVQSASTPNGVLYITGAPRYNHTGRVVIYQLNENYEVVVSQILKGEQVSKSPLVLCIYAETTETLLITYVKAAHLG